MMVRRTEALSVLYPAYAAWPRLAYGALAWALALTGALFVGRGMAAAGSGMLVAGGSLVVVAACLGAVVAWAGGRVTRALAAWLTLPMVVRADGSTITAPEESIDVHSERLHELIRSQDRRSGAGGLRRDPLVRRSAPAVVMGAAAVASIARVGAGFTQATAPFASDDLRGAWFGAVLVAASCAIVAVVLAAGLARVHRARRHRVPYRERRVAAPAAPSPANRAPVTAAPRAVAPSTTVPRAVTPGAVAPGAVPRNVAAPATADPVPPERSSRRPAQPPQVIAVDGSRLAQGTTLVGRDPRARAGEHADHVVTVDDRSVSKTHLTVEITAGAVTICDRGSTNGTTVIRGGRRRACPSGERIDVMSGDEIALGDVTALVVGELADVERTVVRGGVR